MARTDRSGCNTVGKLPKVTQCSAVGIKRTARVENNGHGHVTGHGRSIGDSYRKAVAAIDHVAQYNPIIGYAAVVVHLRRCNQRIIPAVDNSQISFANRRIIDQKTLRIEDGPTGGDTHSV